MYLSNCFRSYSPKKRLHPKRPAPSAGAGNHVPVAVARVLAEVPLARRPHDVLLACPGTEVRINGWFHWIILLVHPGR